MLLNAKSWVGFIEGSLGFIKENRFLGLVSLELY